LAKETVAEDYEMNKKYRVNSTNIIVLAAVCMVLLTSILGTIANQTESFTNKRSSAQVEQRDLGTTNGVSATVEDKHDAAKAEFKPDELLIKFKTASASSINSVIEGFKATILHHFRMIDVYHVRLPENLTLTAALDLFRNNAQVEYAEPNYIYNIGAPTTPNDPLFNGLWGLHNTGQTGGTLDADIDAPEAWDIRTGNKSIVVAVIDTGVDYTHEDLTANMWRNPGETANGIDDDLNGYVDDIYGIDTFNNDADPYDDNGHGTHCSGTIGAVGNNSIGVTGVNWNTSIMALKFLSSGGWGYTDDAIECIEYAIMMKTAYSVNVRVLSNSWGSGSYSHALYDAIAAAGASNMLFVAAAGNQYGNNNDLLPFYPASYDLNNIISVAATDHNDDLAWFSNWGPSSVDVGAPGVNILSTVPTNAYGSYSGTSMATPHVSGLAALVLDGHPSYSCMQVKTRILTTVDKLSSLTGKVLTDGRINAWRALTTADTALYLDVVEPAEEFPFIKSAEYNISAWVHTVSDSVLGATVTANFSTGEPDITLKDDGVPPDRLADDGVYTGAWVPGVLGDVTVGFSASASGLTPASTLVSGNVKYVPKYLVEETAYEWIEVSDTLIGQCIGDEDYLTLTLPFPVYFYGDEYLNLTVGSDGNVDFEDKYVGYSITPVPSANSYGVERLLAVFWDDLNMRTVINHGTLFYGIVGSSPNRVLVIEWKDIAHYYDTGSSTFEALFYENSTDIVLQYQDVSFENPSYDFGASATVGLQYNNVWGTQFSYNTASLSNGLALRFYSSQVSSLQSLASEVMGAQEENVYYLRTGNIYDDSALGFVYGKSVQSQNIISQNNPTFINQTSGAPLVSGDIVIFGGRSASKVMQYYESQGIAWVWCDVNAAYYTFKRVDNGQTLYPVAISTYNPSVKDYFVIQAFKDGSRTVLSQWGISAEGTYASGLCFADLVWPHIADFSDSYYIYSWEDLNGDGIQTTNEILLKTSGN
jgi:hypothetical protein